MFSTWALFRHDCDLLFLGIQSNLQAILFGGWFVRKPTLRDLPYLLKIDLLTQEHENTTPATSVYPWTDDELQFLLTSYYNHFLVAYKGTRPVGFVQYTFEGGYVFIEKIATHPQFQRQGVATELVFRLLPELTGELNYLEVWLRETNLRGIRFFTQTLRRRLSLSSNLLEVVHDAYADTREDSIVLKIEDTWKPDEVTCGQNNHTR